jgi:hypothetical protein
MKRPIHLFAKALIFLFLSSTQITAQESWFPSELTGFGYSSNHSVKSMHSFKGSIYAGMASDSGKVYRSMTGNPGSWTPCFYDTNLSSINHFTSTTNGAGYLYAGAFAPYGTIGSIYKTTDGTNWDLFHTSSSSINFIESYKGQGTVDSIYSFEAAPFGDQVRRAAYNSNDPFDTLSTWDTIFDFVSVSPYTRVVSTGQHNGKMFMGTSSATLWSYDGVSFVQNVYVGNGFGDPANYEISAVGSFGGYLYVATKNYTDGTQIWRSNDEITWTMLIQDPSYEKATAFTASGGMLWVSLISISGGPGLIVRSTDGLTFISSSNNGFGDPNNKGIYGNFCTFGNNLYYGSENFGSGPAIDPAPGDPETIRGGGFSTGGQIWRYCLSTPPVITIGPDQTTCQGTPVNFIADPGFVSYLWDDMSTASSLLSYSGGEHYVLAIDTNGCTAADTAQLNVNPVPDVNIVSPSFGIATVCYGDSISIGATAVSNVRILQPPVSKTSNVIISNPLGNTYDTINITGISECSCTALYSVTIDSLYHNYNIDVGIGLYSPSGFFINLANNAYGANYIGTEFIMDASSMVTDNGTVAPYTGQYLPQDPFSNLTGTSNGNWIIQTNDNYSTDDGVLKGWTLKFALADSLLVYSWNPTTGVSISTILNPTITPSTSTLYTLTTTNSIGCTDTDTVDLFVPAISIAAASDSLCYGTGTMLATSGTVNTIWSPSGSLSSSTGTSVMATPAVSTMYHVNDTIAGCAATDSLMLTVNPQLMADAGFDQTICFGDSATISGTGSGGTWPYFFLWTGGAGPYSGPAELVGPVTNTTYTLTLTDDFGCTTIDSSDVLVAPSTDIYGNVSYSGGNVAGSSVVLYKYYPYQTHFDTVQTTTTDASGNYYFGSVDHENYLIEVFPAATYTTLVPTYYGNTFLWDSATVISHYCAVDDTLNIMSVEEMMLSSGPGYLHGRIVEDTGYVRAPGDPIPGVDVKLGRNPGGQLVTNGQTNNNGEYEFMNVPYGDYTVYADIPGLGRDSSYTFTVDSVNSIYNYLDYIVDSSTIYIVPNAGVGIHPVAALEKNKFIVYPNPSKGDATVEYSINSDADVSLGVYNILGLKIIEVVNTHQREGIYKFNLSDKHNDLTSGVYFVTLIVDGKVNIHKIIITE